MLSKRPNNNSPQEEFGIIEIKEHIDERGLLCVVDPEKDSFPFVVKRIFWIYGVPKGQQRGQHAHRTCAELVVPLRGSFTAHVTDGRRTANFIMDNPCRGLYIPPMVWCSFSDFTADCVCLCLASQAYELQGYINDKSLFLKEIME